MGLRILILCVVCPYIYAPSALDPSVVSTPSGGKRKSGQVEMGLARSAQDKQIIRKAMEKKRNNGGTLKETQQVGRQMARELNKKNDREVQRILKVYQL